MCLFFCTACKVQSALAIIPDGKISTYLYGITSKVFRYSKIYVSAPGKGNAGTASAIRMAGSRWSTQEKGKGTSRWPQAARSQCTGETDGMQKAPGNRSMRGETAALWMHRNVGL